MTVLIIAILIIRVAVVSTKDVTSDMTWLYFWSNIELIIALVVSSLALFRQLYVSSQPERPGVRSTTIFGSGSTPKAQGIFSNGKHYKLGSSKWSGNTRTEGLRKDSSNSTELFNVLVGIVD
ncbi:hypothetical protein LARI1_G008027 [Lachnellula arida]|uniref:Uncharacterized protein n=1 Tax=Lachnellula arida TaxID=1316785 RepID=A0A8T9B0S8_9HELO|nr:hypothetical protein LARI1_G008027 [Lachnellula arida]